MPKTSSTPTDFNRNNLDRETSPYLLQHRDNPVHWQPWSKAVLDHARETGKPILLSVGYAACHWCHVMAHESFENEDIAGLMNEHFVNVKVDREERPDLDSIYQTALALLGEQGGWPLTMFLTPDGEPFWGGTYFPPVAHYGRPGFADVLRGVAHIYADEPEKIAKNVGALRDALERLSQPQGGGQISITVIDQIAERLVREIDPFHGGVGQAPKFPQTPVLDLLWRAWKRTGKVPYRDAVLNTLSRMSLGGIYDHVGGGYARYAVDAAWLVPHFEKMLYDNAQLIELLTAAWQETGDPLYAARVDETVSWALREMIAKEGVVPVGAFGSSLDADSEGEEGKFYVWTEAEIDAVLGDDAALFKRHYDVTAEGNWEGKTILNRSALPPGGRDDAELGDAAVAEREAKLTALRERLFEARSARVRPGWDDKVLADWNGLMISALATAGSAFDKHGWIEAAADAFMFVSVRMTEGDRLMHSWRGSFRRHAAVLEDYAAMTRAAVRLYEVTGKQSYLDQAETWAEHVERHYADGDRGGYFTTANDVRDVIIRTKSANDSATPSGNGLFLEALVRLHFLTGKQRYLERAEGLVKAFSGEISRNFFPLSTLISNSELLQDPVQVVVIGDRRRSDTREMLRSLFRRSVPNRVLQQLADGQALPEGHPAAGKEKVNGLATAYVCRAMTCSPPITDSAELAAALDDL